LGPPTRIGNRSHRSEGDFTMTLTKTTRTLFSRDTRGITLLLALLFGVAGFGSHFISLSGEPASASLVHVSDATCDDGLPQTDEQPWVRSELFFGTSKPDGTAVTQSEWKGFLDGVITPRFPDGLTVMTGFGQWQEADDEIVQERSMLLILLYPSEFALESGTKIEEIRSAYEQEFQQESVLRTDDSFPVCTSI
jgi:hypothetical protein